METIYNNGKNIGVLSFVSHVFGTSSYNLPRALLLGKRARLELDVSFRSSAYLCLVLSCLVLSCLVLSFFFVSLCTHLYFPPARFSRIVSFVFVSIFLKLDVDTAPIRLRYHGGSHYDSLRENGINYPLKPRR